MSNELKLCPFCGGKAELHIHDMSIYCNDCDAGVTNHTVTKQDLIDGWNTRTSLKDELIDELKQKGNEFIDEHDWSGQTKIASVYTMFHMVNLFEEKLK